MHHIACIWGAFSFYYEEELVLLLFCVCIVCFMPMHRLFIMMPLVFLYSAKQRRLLQNVMFVYPILYSRYVESPYGI